MFDCRDGKDILRIGTVSAFGQPHLVTWAAGRSSAPMAMTAACLWEISLIWLMTCTAVILFEL